MNAVFRIHRYPLNYPGFEGKIFDLEAEKSFNRLYGYEAMQAVNRRQV